MFVCISKELFIQQRGTYWYIDRVHPGARPTNGLVPKMVRFLWQELDEVGDFGRFPVKKRPRFSPFWTCWTSARLPRGFLTRWRGNSGRRERLAGLSTTAVTLKDTRSRDFARILHFQLAIGALSSIAAEPRENSRPGVVHGDRSYAPPFESVIFIGRLQSTA